MEKLSKTYTNLHLGKHVTTEALEDFVNRVKPVIDVLYELGPTFYLPAAELSRECNKIEGYIRHRKER